ncbi:MAG: hypothetical protein II235_01570 [Muribaculaceae bacterium]|nr:hypothetical protein [Muribaculaceae bacterium]
MMPGNPQILICPFCGTEKQIMSLISGNTFGAELWSDNKQIAPMLPEISYVQKCPHCGKYYITERQEVKYAKDGYSFEKGLLTYPEMKEAFTQLSEEGFLNENEEINVRMMLHHAYNDYYYRTEEKKVVSEEDKTLFHKNGLWLINNLITDSVMKAEFYREIGEIDTARSILDSITVEDEFLKRIVTAIKDRLEVNNCQVFKLQTS